jgi:hypothetical protein
VKPNPQLPENGIDIPELRKVIHPSATAKSRETLSLGRTFSAHTRKVRTTSVRDAASAGLAGAAPLLNTRQPASTLSIKGTEHSA